MFANTSGQIADAQHGRLDHLWPGERAQDLPGFVVLTSLGRRRPEPADRRPSMAPRFCPAAFRECIALQRRPCSTSARPASHPAASTMSSARLTPSMQIRRRWMIKYPLIAQYEMAFQMQAACQV
jgi:hypothetical protein